MIGFAIPAPMRRAYFNAKTGGERMSRHLVFPFFLMVVQAVVFGATFSINKLAAAAGVPAFAYAFWQSLAGGLLLLIIVGRRGDRLGLTRAHLVGYLVIGAFSIGFPSALLTTVAPKLPAGALTLVLALTPSFTYVVSMVVGLERFKALALLGLALGFAGVAVVVLPGTVLGAPGLWAWYLLGLVAPLLFGAANVGAAVLRPPVASSVSMGCGVLFGSALALLPVVLASGQIWIPIGAPFDALWPVGVATAISAYVYAMFFVIVRMTGPTFFSQLNYFAVLAGTGWSMAILGERPSIYLFVAMGLMLVGVFVAGYRSKSMTEARPAPDTPAA
jgi:drug/metabolite transporter (DMT)-like permease